MKMSGAIMVGVLVASASAYAIPALQLDIGDGTYNTATETIVASSDTFSLYTLLSPKKEMDVSSLYRVSAAVIPKQSDPLTSPAPDLGTFSFAGTTYDVTGDMVYGLPPARPIEGTTGVEGSLSKHEVFPTYFTEFDVIFDENMQCAEYNTEDDVGAPGSFYGPGETGLYYQEFAVDVSGLADGYGIHFDLYRLDVKAEESDGSGHRSKTCTPPIITYVTDFDSDERAPFSHDAESGTSRTPPDDPPPHVPDQSTTVTLLGLALMGIEVMRRSVRRG
jgi:hypothetical protein